MVMRRKMTTDDVPVAAPAPEATPAPAPEATPAPAPEATPAPVTEATPAPVTEATPAPAPEAAPAPVTEAAPAPVTEAAPPATKQAPTPATQRVKGFSGLILDDKESLFAPKFGTLPRVKASNGNLMSGETILGRSIKIQILSWNKLWIVGPCDTKAPSELVKYSLDGADLDDGSGSVKDWVSDMKDAGWPDAASKEYNEIVASLIEAEQDKGLVGEMIHLQLAPTSATDFEGYRLQTSFKVAQGLVQADSVDVVVVSAEIVTNKGNTWTKMAFKKA